MKSTTKQENNRTLKKTVFFIFMFRPQPRGLQHMQLYKHENKGENA